ncbi:hypothetical protein LAZ67_1007701 [Cordylochernes scorpioides]|uniref:DUF4817 domain-containing protein n=1 Tax=Cordylochernes scorpioides TaxID=51811 RepID=A0ABY6K2N6_9ARAC|nr:hypothetical protein LAZ67_1007701 [Cordylochernes scorpioides]
MSAVATLVILEMNQNLVKYSKGPGGPQGESATEALRAFRSFKDIRSGKGPMSCYSLKRLIKSFEETGSLEAKPRSGRPLTCKSVAVTVLQNAEAIEMLSTYGEAIDDRVENINQRLQKLEESSAVTKTALSQNSKKIKDLEDQLEYLDAKRRERNLIFYGIEQDNNEDCRERIRKVIEEYMQTTEKINITRCHRLSRKPGAPILIEVPEQNDRSTLFKAAFNLRGTKISLSKDYSMKMREQRRVLNVKRRELVEKGTLAKLRDNKLIINGIAYKVCDGQIVDANGHSL